MINSHKVPKMHENISYYFWIRLCHWNKSWKVRLWYSEIAEFPNGIIHFGSLCLVWLPVQGHEQELGNGGIKLETTLKEILIQKADICTVFGFVEFLKIKKKYWNRKIKKMFFYNFLDFSMFKVLIRSEQFLKQNAFLACSWRFLRSS